MAITVITDSTAYLPEAYIQQYQIQVVSLNVIMDQKSYRELDLSNETFYQEMTKRQEIPKSSQPTPDEFIQCFEIAAQNGNDIVGIFISGELSGTFNNANVYKAKILEKYPEIKIEIIDSRTCCMQMGYAVLEAAKAAANKKSFDEVIHIAKHVLQHSRFLFSPDTLEYLKKGGRIGGAAALIGNLFQIKPILTVKDGKADVFTKVRTRKKAMDTIVQQFIEEVGEKGFGGATVHHIHCEEEGQLLAKRIKEKFGQVVPIQSIGPIIGIHVGPGSIGIAYHFHPLNNEK